MNSLSARVCVGFRKFACGGGQSEGHAWTLIESVLGVLARAADHRTDSRVAGGLCRFYAR